MMVGTEKQPEIMENTQAMIPTLTPLSIVASIQAYTCLMTDTYRSIYIYIHALATHIV